VSWQAAKQPQGASATCHMPAMSSRWAAH